MDTKKIQVWGVHRITAKGPRLSIFDDKQEAERFSNETWAKRKELGVQRIWQTSWYAEPGSWTREVEPE